MKATSAGTLEIDFITNLAKLKSDMDQAQRSVGTTTTQMSRSLDGMTKSAGFNRMQMITAQSAVMRFTDAIIAGQSPMRAFALEAHKVGEVVSMDNGGMIGGLKKIGGLALALGAPLAVAAVAFKRWDDQINQQAGLKAYADQLGLTKKEVEKLGGAHVSMGDIAKGVWKTLSDDVSRAFKSMQGTRLVDYLFSPNDAQQVGNFIASIYGAFVGGYHAIIETWRQFPAALGDLFVQAVNKAIAAVQWLTNAGIDAVNALGGSLAHVDFGQMANSFKGQAKAVGDVFTSEVGKATKQANDALKNFVHQSAVNAAQIARDRFKDAAADKTDKHAEALARAAAAEEAQIKGLYALAAAYKVSDAAALIAEATEKANVKEIKARGDAEAEVSRQIRLAIAQRVVDAARSAAGMTAEAAVQARVNAAVAAGLVPQAAAADMVRDQIAQLPILGAIQAAQQKGYKDAVVSATQALHDQETAQESLRAAQIGAQFNADQSAGGDQIAELQEELRLIGATDSARVHALATLKATQEASTKLYDPKQTAEYIATQVRMADLQKELNQKQAQFGESVRLAADLADSAADSMAKAFGRVGESLGDVIKILGEYGARQKDIDDQVKAGTLSQDAGIRKSADLQLSSLIGITDAAKNLFSEHSKGYKAMAAAEKALTLIQLARTVVDVAGGAARMFATMGPLAFPAVGAMLAVMASLGFAGHGGGGGSLSASNSGKGTTLGASDTESASIKNSIEALGDIDRVTMTYSAQMAASLKSIESNIGGLASLLVRTGNISGATAGVQTGFKTSGLGSVLSAGYGALQGIPIIGDIAGAISSVIKSLFGTKTSIIGSGIFGGSQNLSSILSGGFDLQTYADIQKKKKFLGITTGTSTSTQYGAADSQVADQFGLILKSFYDAIGAAAVPLGKSTADVEHQLDSFVVSIGKIDFTGLSGDDIQKKLEAVFGAAADQMAAGAFPQIIKFQQVGEGAFQTLTRVANTVETVTSELTMLGLSSKSLGIDASMAIAGLFDSVDATKTATDAYFTTFYTTEEQTAIKTKQLSDAFGSLGMTLPANIAAYRSLVEAQDLNTAAGQQTYAMLIQLAPAFAQISTAAQDATSAAAILRERQDLESKLLDLQGDTVAIRAAELAKLDPSNRALQEQIYALTDQQAAAQAAAEAEQAAAAAAQAAAQKTDALRQAWQSIGQTIEDEINRIRGLTGAGSTASYASLMGQFNAATDAARHGDQDAAKSLPELSKELLDAATLAATSKQELDRVQAQTAASLQQTLDMISAATAASSAATSSVLGADTSASDNANWWNSYAPPASNGSADVHAEIAGMRSDLRQGLAVIAKHTGKAARVLDDVSNGAQTINTVAA